MIASNDFLIMKNRNQVYELVPTRLKAHTQSLYALAFVTTSLQIQPDDLELKQYNVAATYPNAYGIVASSTLLQSDLPKILSRNTETTFFNQDSVEVNNDFYIKPNYKKVFKLAVKKLKIDKSLPKIFLD